MVETIFTLSLQRPINKHSYRQRITVIEEKLTVKTNTEIASIHSIVFKLSKFIGFCVFESIPNSH